jgi:predicted TPR repeat methyltransferase
VLRRSGRFAHGANYLGRVAGEAGLRVMLCRRASVRQEDGRPVEGIVVLLEHFCVSDCAQQSQ